MEVIGDLLSAPAAPGPRQRASVGAYRRVPVDIVGDGSERHVDVAPAERLELLLHQPDVIVGGHPLLQQSRHRHNHRAGGDRRQPVRGDGPKQDRGALLVS